MNMYSQRTSVENKTKEVVAFGIKDQKGREIGMVVERCVETFKQASIDNGRAYWCVDPGKYFTVTAQVARNGERYGAGQSEARFLTEAEREAYIQKRIQKAIKDNSKKFGPALA